ncbi:hypothetical protein TKK_0003419 [Trichogramma kaykai]
MLIDSGADIEARNRHGDTPLQSAVMRFDVALTKSLLDHGASLGSLSEKRMFIHYFSSLELTAYAVSLNIIEVMQLLQSAGYNMDFHTKLRMVQCWIRIHGNDFDRMLVKDTGIRYSSASDDKNQDIDMFVQIVDQLTIHRKFGFYMKQEVKDYMSQRCAQLGPTIPNGWDNYGLPSRDIEWEDMGINEYMPTDHDREIDKINNIMITEDVSLYQLSKMNYSEGYSILKNIKNWRVPQINDLTCEGTFARFIVRRHLSYVAARVVFDLESLAADLFMTDHCTLNLPHLVCLKVAENMSYEDLFSLFEKINVDEIEQQSEADDCAIVNRFVRHSL